MAAGVPFRVGAAAVEYLPNTQRLLHAVKNVWVEMMQDGVTTMRCAGSKDYLNIELRNVLSDGIFRGPRIFSTGPMHATTGGHGTRGADNALEVDGPDEVHKAVRLALKKGADWIKLCLNAGLSGIHAGEHPSIEELTAEEVRVAVEEAHKRGRKVMVHGGAAKSIKTAILEGVDCIEHGYLLDEEAIAMMKEKHISYVPTMSGIYAVYARERAGDNQALADYLEETIRPHAENVAKAIKAGVLIGTGTDTLGFVRQELEMLVQCGMSRAEALAAGTINSARILGLEQELGSVEPGKIADLVVLEANPLEDLKAIHKIRHLIVKGELMTWETLVTNVGG
jgi:imidazolonepropionase-like amidohydrolase